MSITTVDAPNSLSHIYAIGSLRPFLATRDLQKEFEAAAKELDLPENDYYGVFSYSSTPAHNEALTFRPYLYIAEKASWVFSINNVDTYMLLPKYNNELDALIAALKQSQSSQQVAIIGALGVNHADETQNDLHLPTVLCNHIVSLPLEDMAPINLKANDGVSSVSRAINFVICNFNTLVPAGLDLKGALTEINFQHYSKDGDRSLIEIILTYLNQDLEVFYSCGIDVTDEYPFINFPLRNFLPQTA
ncbi:hypothetical protein L2755_19695 [Shewanella abyssi]|uniref:hypothetical protein n=1 Tax=Shewanella abyssi TaxID=311789 RepID=UPI00200CECEF|nr:hypothetical protein [Shewanella abyssi]MCL1051830.1 hypothetical protein [Shewanella abyssi]